MKEVTIAAHGDGQTPSYHDTASAYALPNDATEHERLEYQARAMEMVMHDEPFHAPLQNPRRILDIGCGTGRSTVQLARRFPNAQVIGVDLSVVPPVHERPHNVEYVQGEFQELVESGDCHLQAGTFDYVFSRLLVLGMNQWPRYFDLVSGLLAPGGWVETHEVEITVWDGTGHRLWDEAPAVRAYHHLASLKGLDLAIGAHVKQMMQERGLQEVRQEMYKFAFSVLPEAPETEMIQKVTVGLPKILAAVWLKLGQNVYSRQQIEELRGAHDEFFAQRGPDDFFPLFVVIGRKGLQ